MGWGPWSCALGPESWRILVLVASAPAKTPTNLGGRGSCLPAPPRGPCGLAPSVVQPAYWPHCPVCLQGSRHQLYLLMDKAKATSCWGRRSETWGRWPTPWWSADPTFVYQRES